MNVTDMDTQEQMMALVREMSGDERKELLVELYRKGIFHDDRFRYLVGVDEKIFMENVSEYEAEVAENALQENVPEELLKEMIKEEEESWKIG